MATQGKPDRKITVLNGSVKDESGALDKYLKEHDYPNLIKCADNIGTFRVIDGLPEGWVTPKGSHMYDISYPVPKSFSSTESAHTILNRVLVRENNGPKDEYGASFSTFFNGDFINVTCFDENGLEQKKRLDSNEFFKMVNKQWSDGRDRLRRIIFDYSDIENPSVRFEFHTHSEFCSVDEFDTKVQEISSRYPDYSLDRYPKTPLTLSKTKISAIISKDDCTDEFNDKIASVVNVDGNKIEGSKYCFDITSLESIYDEHSKNKDSFSSIIDKVKFPLKDDEVSKQMNKAISHAAYSSSLVLLNKYSHEYMRRARAKDMDGDYEFRIQMNINERAGDYKIPPSLLYESVRDYDTYMKALSSATTSLGDTAKYLKQRDEEEGCPVPDCDGKLVYFLVHDDSRNSMTLCSVPLKNYGEMVKNKLLSEAEIDFGTKEQGLHVFEGHITSSCGNVGNLESVALVEDVDGERRLVGVNAEPIVEEQIEWLPIPTFEHERERSYDAYNLEHPNKLKVYYKKESDCEFLRRQADDQIEFLPDSGNRVITVDPKKKRPDLEIVCDDKTADEAIADFVSGESLDEKINRYRKESQTSKKSNWYDDDENRVLSRDDRSDGFGLGE